MNIEISKKQMIVMIIVILLMFLLVLRAYFSFIWPLNKEILGKRSELKAVNVDLVLAEKEIKQFSEQMVIGTTELQKKVPVKRLLDQLLLDIEKAEIISDTRITELKLNGTNIDEEVEFNTDKNETDTTENTSNETENTKPEKSSNVSEEKLPNGIKRISFSLKGEANTYFEMESFITSLESLKRIVKVDALKFTGVEEIFSVDQEEQSVEFELTIAGYYFPKLEDLRDELPPLDTPESANKKNPLSSFSDKSNEDTEEKQP